MAYTDTTRLNEKQVDSTAYILSGLKSFNWLIVFFLLLGLEQRGVPTDVVVIFTTITSI